MLRLVVVVVVKEKEGDPVDRVVVRYLGDALAV